MICLAKLNAGRVNGTDKSMSDFAAITASLKAALEAEARLTVAIRHSEQIGALPPKLMAARRELYEARLLLASAISNLKERSL